MNCSTPMSLSELIALVLFVYVVGLIFGFAYAYAGNATKGEMP